jgi:hypothetical protein
VTGKIRIAHLAGANATIQSAPPLVTSNKARMNHQLPLRCGPDGTPLRYDVLRPQRLATPAKVYVEQFSAHPLEGDAAELHGPPDGYLQADGSFSRERTRPWSSMPSRSISSKLRDPSGRKGCRASASGANGCAHSSSQADPSACTAM